MGCAIILGWQRPPPILTGANREKQPRMDANRINIIRDWEWVITKKVCDWVAPGARKHISHYSRSELVRRFENHGFRLDAVRYTVRGEAILAFRKPQR
jgi:hypothetical protein